MHVLELLDELTEVLTLPHVLKHVRPLLASRDLHVQTTVVRRRFDQLFNYDTSQQGEFTVSLETYNTIVLQTSFSGQLTALVTRNKSNDVFESLQYRQDYYYYYYTVDNALAVNESMIVIL